MRKQNFLRQSEDEYRTPEIRRLSLPATPKPDLHTEIESMFEGFSNSHLIDVSELAAMTVVPQGKSPAYVVSQRNPSSYDAQRRVDLSERGLVCKVPGYQGEQIDEEEDCVEEMVKTCVDRIFR